MGRIYFIKRTENCQKLHKQLREDGKGAGANEWYFHLNHIMDIIYSLYIELVGTIDSAKNGKSTFMIWIENLIY